MLLVEVRIFKCALSVNRGGEGFACRQRLGFSCRVLPSWSVQSAGCSPPLDVQCCS